MATRVRSILACIGADQSGDVSLLARGFGFIRGRVPPDPDTSVRAEVSVLEWMRGLKGRHIHLNVIRMGFDTLFAADQATALERIDYAIYRTRNIYRQVALGVGRVLHWFVNAADANGRDDIGSEDESEQLWEEWSVPNGGIDVFVVRNISDTDFVGRSPVGGSCDKDGKDDGLLGGEINREPEGFSRSFAHEIGHFLGLSHNHGKDECPATNAGRRRLMAQTRCAATIDLRTTVNLTSGEGTTMRRHCSVRAGC